MPRIFLATAILLAAFLVLSPGADAQVSAPTRGDVDAAQAVIAAQMDAFKRNDGQAAYAFATPGIKNVFATPDVFMEMVRTQYEPVYRPAYVEFREAVATSEELIQKVFIIGENNRAVLAIYSLEQGDDGAWRIAGCMLYPAPPDEQPL